jgi:hypothetical protein
MEDFLTLVSGIAWTLVYIDAIRVGFKDKSYAMPLFALALNLGWELGSKVRLSPTESGEMGRNGVSLGASGIEDAEGNHRGRQCQPPA